MPSEIIKRAENILNLVNELKKNKDSLNDPKQAAVLKQKNSQAIQSIKNESSQILNLLSINSSNVSKPVVPKPQSVNISQPKTLQNTMASSPPVQQSIP